MVRPGLSLKKYTLKTPEAFSPNPDFANGQSAIMDALQSGAKSYQPKPAFQTGDSTIGSITKLLGGIGGDGKPGGGAGTSTANGTPVNPVTADSAISPSGKQNMLDLGAVKAGVEGVVGLAGLLRKPPQKVQHEDFASRVAPRQYDPTAEQNAIARSKNVGARGSSLSEDLAERQHVNSQADARNDALIGKQQAFNLDEQLRVTEQQNRDAANNFGARKEREDMNYQEAKQGYDAQQGAAQASRQGAANYFVDSSNDKTRLAGLEQRNNQQLDIYATTGANQALSDMIQTSPQFADQWHAASGNPGEQEKIYQGFLERYQKGLGDYKSNMYGNGNGGLKGLFTRPTVKARSFNMPYSGKKGLKLSSVLK